MTGRLPGPHRIDAHAHCLAPAYKEALGADLSNDRRYRQAPVLPEGGRGDGDEQWLSRVGVLVHELDAGIGAGEHLHFAPSLTSPRATPTKTSATTPRCSKPRQPGVCRQNRSAERPGVRPRA
jgi:hypothetical protein